MIREPFEQIDAFVAHRGQQAGAARGPDSGARQRGKRQARLGLAKTLERIAGEFIRGRRLQHAALDSTAARVPGRKRRQHPREPRIVRHALAQQRQIVGVFQQLARQIGKFLARQNAQQRGGKCRAKQPAAQPRQHRGGPQRIGHGGAYFCSDLKHPARHAARVCTHDFETVERTSARAVEYDAPVRPAGARPRHAEKALRCQRMAQPREPGVIRLQPKSADGGRDHAVTAQLQRTQIGCNQQHELPVGIGNERKQRVGRAVLAHVYVRRAGDEQIAAASTQMAQDSRQRTGTFRGRGGRRLHQHGAAPGCRRRVGILLPLAQEPGKDGRDTGSPWPTQLVPESPRYAVHTLSGQKIQAR